MKIKLAFTATATDTSGILNYALSGTDANSFNIDSTSGVVTLNLTQIMKQNHLTL